jgi:hypothetical protein
VRSADGILLLHESRYFITSLDPGTVTSAELHAYIRGHWQVEYCLHFVKDRWWDEDRHYTKRPGLAESFASLTSAALSVLRLIHLLALPLRATAETIPWHPLPTWLYGSKMTLQFSCVFPGVGCHQTAKM